MRAPKTASAAALTETSGSPRRVASIEEPGTGRAAALALNAFMSMRRAIAILGSDGKLLMHNLMFAELFGGSRLMEQINRGIKWRDRRIKISDGRTFWVEGISMDDGWLISAFDMTDQLAQERTDALTQLGNELSFREKLTGFAPNPPAPETVAVLTIDLNRFKAINDALGRDVGDALLCIVAKRILSTAGPDDTVARLHGDKFGVIQIGPQPQSATALATRLVDLLARSYLLDGQLITIGASVGIALVPGGGAADCDSLLKNANIALHVAKQGGVSDYRFFETWMEEDVQARRTLEIDLRRALALREFSLVYQPQFNLKANAVTGFEALLRWHCPTRGAVSPLDFIPLAEETGIITQIGEWVLRTACLEAANWPGNCSVAVNVSAIQFASPGLLVTILSALGESGLDPRRLELEITESVMLDARGAALGTLQQLHELGVHISLDDFGTGYSSLGYLRSFPFDKIKIDQSFVRGASDDRGGRAIVSAIASLGQSLGIATVAEGVETEEQMARIVAEGCTDVQGYLISRPIRPELIHDFLASSAAARPGK